MSHALKVIGLVLALSLLAAKSAVAGTVEPNPIEDIQQIGGVRHCYETVEGGHIASKIGAFPPREGSDE